MGFLTQDMVDIDAWLTYYRLGYNSWEVELRSSFIKI
jgi:hypothetical protein